MDFGDTVSSISEQFGIALKSPIPVVVLVAIVGTIIWKALSWHYSGRVIDLEQRIQLRDDRLEELGRKVEELGLNPQPVANLSSTTRPGRLTKSPTLQSPTNAPENKLAGRVFIPASTTVGDLRAIYESTTGIRAEKLASSYIGKWVAVSGWVQSVSSMGKGALVKINDQGPDLSLTGVWSKFASVPEELELLSKRDKVSVIGRVETITEFDVTLIECELTHD